MELFKWHNETDSVTVSVLTCMKVKVTQSCQTLLQPHDYTVHGILQVRILWSGWPFPSPEELPNPEMEPRSPTLQVDSLPAEPQVKPTDLQSCLIICLSSPRPWYTTFSLILKDGFFKRKKYKEPAVGLGIVDEV